MPSEVFDPRGAESYVTVRRAPRSEKTPLGVVHRRPQPEAGEKCGRTAAVTWPSIENSEYRIEKSIDEPRFLPRTERCQAPFTASADGRRSGPQDRLDLFPSRPGRDHGQGGGEAENTDPDQVAGQKRCHQTEDRRRLPDRKTDDD